MRAHCELFRNKLDEQEGVMYHIFTEKIKNAKQTGGDAVWHLKNG